MMMIENSINFVYVKKHKEKTIKSEMMMNRGNMSECRLIIYCRFSLPSFFAD